MGARKILVVDDTKTSVIVLSRALQAGGFDVVTAGNGREAVDLAAAERPDLVVMDVVMPIMDGLAALRELRRNPSTRNIPVILVTARPEMLEQEVLPRWDDCIAKPTDAALLLAKVRRLLARPSE